MFNSAINLTNSYQVKKTIKPYYRKSRKSVVLKGLVINKVIEFQTPIRCTADQFDSDGNILIQIDEYKDKLAHAIVNNNSLETVRKTYYQDANATNPLSLNDVVVQFVTQYKNIMVPDHLRHFKTLLRSLLLFNNIQDSDDLPMSNLNNEHIKNYTNYLLNKGLENTTIKGHLKRYRRIVKYACDELGLNINVSSTTVKLKEKQPFVVFLNKSEVTRFAQVETKTPGELEVKNGFLFRCYTGIRFSEMPYIDINNYDGKVLSFYIPKTSKSHQIPLNRKAMETLVHIKRFSPISQQKENQYIKILAKRAKIERPVQKVKLSGSVSTVETFPKWKLCSSHTARRTWARIAYDAGVDILKISRYIGHSDIATTLKYIGHKDTDFDELKDLF